MKNVLKNVKDTLDTLTVIFAPKLAEPAQLPARTIWKVMYLPALIEPAETVPIPVIAFGDWDGIVYKTKDNIVDLARCLY
ncbi:hypothetical protein [Echinicola pacifica]|uniref:hypothetical protein n=1 Tax=Echinicola pacifica TaxID=346377 RepID=UPI0003602488|nr:hypothetical protein [Echinicola pacifica]